MLVKFPRSLRRWIRKINQFLEQWPSQINRYNARPQLRPRTSSGSFLASRSPTERTAPARSRASRQRYTAAEIKEFLQGQPQPDINRVRDIATQFQVGRLAEILDRPIPKRFYGREWLYSRLVTVTNRYAQKVSPAEIADSLSCFYKVDDVEEAIEYVATLVAESLNKSNSFWF